MTLLLLLAAALPTLLAPLLLATSRISRLGLRLAPWAPLPLLLLSFRPDLFPVDTIEWLLLGARIGLDPVSRVFILFTTLLWTVAGLYARAYLAADRGRRGFFVVFLLTMTGNFGLLVSHDLVGFYLSFALMTFAAYPLVVYQRTEAAYRAGRIYIVMAVLGETMLLSALLMAGAATGGTGLEELRAGIATSSQRHLIMGLLILGFGVKAGALPLHVWLPLAHPVAPTPASAVLSGSMIKAGLLGWIRFLPVGEAAFPLWGGLILGAGLLAAFFGVVIGALQTDAKTALAYSSISQMGIINLAVGIGLTNPDGWPFARAAALAYATHHGLAKGALFLGVGVVAGSRVGTRARLLALGGLAFAALTVAGAPLTSGSIAKNHLKAAAAWSPASWPLVLDWLLPLSAVGTTLLMARFLLIVRRSPDPADDHGLRPALWLPWAVLLVAVAVVLWGVPTAYEIDLLGYAFGGLDGLWVGIWPIVVGLFLAWSLALGLRRRDRPDQPLIEPGDLLLPAERATYGFVAALRRLPLPSPARPVGTLAAHWYGLYASGESEPAHGGLETRLTRWGVAMAGFALLALLFLSLVLLP